MTSKEALEELERINSRQNNGKGDVWLEMIIDGIKKDLDKLDQYKTIEKEIGIDLITLFKAQKQGCIWELVFAGYDKNGKSTYKPRKQEHWFGIDFRAKALIGKWIGYDFKDYGKTWALTKKELENEINND